MQAGGHGCEQEYNQRSRRGGTRFCENPLKSPPAVGALRGEAGQYNARCQAATTQMGSLGWICANMEDANVNDSREELATQLRIASLEAEVAGLSQQIAVDAKIQKLLKSRNEQLEARYREHKRASGQVFNKVGMESVVVKARAREGSGQQRRCPSWLTSNKPLLRRLWESPIPNRLSSRSSSPAPRSTTIAGASAAPCSRFANRAPGRMPTAPSGCAPSATASVRWVLQRRGCTDTLSGSGRARQRS